MKNTGKVNLAALIMMIFAFQVNAQNAATSNQPAQKQNAVKSASGNFVDKDNNGICDKFESRSGEGRGGNIAEKDNNGVCDNFEAWSGKGQSGNFVDKNKDGICDKRCNVGKKSANQCSNGQGNQYRHGHGHANCYRR